MSQFGLGLGVITVSVIAGAIVLDRTMDKTPTTLEAPAKAQPAVAATEAPATSVAGANGNGGESSTVVADASPAMEKAIEPAAAEKTAKASPAPEKPAPAAKANRTRTNVASAPPELLSAAPATESTPDD
jgi:hypothetical protein